MLRSLYNLTSFEKYIHPVTNHQNQDTEHFHRLSSTFIPLFIKLSLPQSNHCSIYITKN